MAERPSSTSAVRSWRSLSSQQLNQEFTSLGLILDREKEVIICAKCQYAFKPSDAVSKHLGDKHGRSAKDGHGLNAFVKQLQLPDPNKLEPRPDGCAPHPCLVTETDVAYVQRTYLPVQQLGSRATAPYENSWYKRWSQVLAARPPSEKPSATELDAKRIWLLDRSREPRG